MKGRILIVLIIAVIVFESCGRVMTPYQAANNPRGKKCAVIR
ncbi:MAG TPA: hypothetical protein PLU11_13220 [Chitinophagaceae bacterium]|nr:hypothetical protein [Chitinophagaceae bacterium]HPN60139.1 hypothetical protein [Chitinophagaceae bacterium]HRG23189.1 hypothetical protein [Chitinophagaceae bacterium]